MTEAEAVKGIRKAAKQRERAKATHEAATADLRRYLHAAQDAGVSVTQIAREAGLSRQGVYDALAERPSS